MGHSLKSWLQLKCLSVTELLHLNRVFCTILSAAWTGSSHSSSSSTAYAGVQDSSNTASTLSAGLRSSSSSSRQLLFQLDLCPTGCFDEACAEDSSRGGLRCLKCQGSLVVDRFTGLCGE